MSVAAVDASKNKASFSQYNKEVNIAAPGVGIVSTVPYGLGSIGHITVPGKAFTSSFLHGSTMPPASGLKGRLVHCPDLGQVPCESYYTRHVCLIER